MINLDEYISCIDNVIYSIKNILYEKDSSIFDKIDFYNDDIFLEPLLFSAILNDNDIDIERSLMSYKDNSLIILNNKENIYIPNIGYLKFHKNIPVDTSIYIKKKNNILSVTDKYENEIQYKIDPIIYIHSNIEFINKNDRLFENLFIDKDEKVIEVDFMDKEPYEKDFIKALDILKKYSPPFYNQLILSLKKIIFFRGNSYCFSTIKVHNCIFFNVNESVNDIYFLEHLLHEGGHIIFNNITFESKNDLFKYNHKTLFKDIKGFEKEHGDLYSRFHGIFTHYIISSNFYEFLKKGIYKDDQKIKELEGRFCFDMNKYKISLDLFSKNILSEKGYRLYYIFLSKFNEIQNNSSISIKTYDLSNQNYMFSFDKLCESNP